MEQIVDYVLVSNKSASGLASAVKARLTDGWVPQGGVAVHPDYDEYVQAMVKYASSK